MTEAEAPARRREAPAPAGLDAAQMVLSLQRSAGNHALAGLLQNASAAQVARQGFGPNLPPGPVGSLIGSLMQAPSTLEMVRDRLSYGVTDWAITDEDVVSATRLLGDMGDAELTDAVNNLDGDSTPYLDRLVNNATLATVRMPQFAKIMKKRSAARNKVLAEQLVSYGFVDWEVTPPEAEAAQALLDALPAADNERLTDDWMKKRIKENLHKEGDYEQGVGEMLLDGALQGDFKEDPTFWNSVGAIAWAASPTRARSPTPATWSCRWTRSSTRAAGSPAGSGRTSCSSCRLHPRRRRRRQGAGQERAARAAPRRPEGARRAVRRGPASTWSSRWSSTSSSPPWIRREGAMQRVVHAVEERVQRFLKGGEPHPHGEGKVVDEAGDALPSPAKLAEDTDQAVKDAAAGAGRRFDDIASEMVHAILDWLKDWCRRIFGDLEIGDIRVVIDGEWLELHGSKLIKVRIKAIKEIVIEKSESIFSKIKERQGKLIAAKQAATDSAKHLLRNDACLVSEEIGERIAEIAMKREFPGATIRFRGKFSGSVDQVFEHGGLLYVVEAKGGGSRLGWREIGADEFAQQGTLAYLDDIIKQMMGSAEKEVRDIATELAARRKKGEVMYMIAKTGPLNASSDPIKAKLLSIRQ